MSELLKIRAKQAQRKAAVLAWEAGKKRRILDEDQGYRDIWVEWLEFEIADLQEKAAEAYDLAMKLNRWHQHELVRARE